MSTSPSAASTKRVPSQQSLNGATIMRPRPIDVFPGSFGVHEQRQYSSYPMVPAGHSPSSSLHLPNGKARESEKDEYLDESEGEETAMTDMISMPSDGIRIIADVFSWEDWKNPHLWKAGVVEAAASGCFNFLTGLIPITLSNFPLAAIPPAVFVGNSTAVALLIFALSTATGAHINPIISISTTFSGLTHPVRTLVYLICQLAGGAVGGAFLRVGIGLDKALKLHNGGCWIEPGGETSLSQAVAIEFMSVFSLLLICYGVGLDPRQARIYGAAMAPVLIGITIGLITSITATIAPGYTGAGMFPGRCFGLAAGIGEFQSSHWVWWIPDIAAALAHSLLYRFAPPYVREIEHVDLGEPEGSKPSRRAKRGGKKAAKK